MKKSCIIIFFLFLLGTFNFFLPTILSLDPSCVPGESINFSDYKKVIVGDSLRSALPVIDACQLSFLSDGDFSGRVFAVYNQTIIMSSYPIFIDNPFALSVGVPSSNISIPGNYTYNTTIKFDKPVNFTHRQSTGRDIQLFGKTFFISSETGDYFNIRLDDFRQQLILLEGKRIDLDTLQAKKVTINNKTYILELFSASDSSAMIRVTDEHGNSDVGEIDEESFGNINNLFIEVIATQDGIAKSSVLLIAVSQRITLLDGGPVIINGEKINGSFVDFGVGNPNFVSYLTISVQAHNSTAGLIKPGETFLDPVYGTFQLRFADVKNDNPVYANIFLEEINPPCTPVWNLQNQWSICDTGLQYKDWIDSNNCNNQTTKPVPINRSCGVTDSDISEKVNELETRIILLELWKNTVSDWIDDAVFTLEELFIFKDEVEETLSNNQTQNYFSYLSSSDRKNILC